MTGGVLSQKSVSEIRVIFADTDAMGIVYHANYIKWFEIGRGEYLRQCGLPYARITAMGYDMPLTEVACRYLAPARYDDILILETEVVYVRGASIKFSYGMWDEARERMIAEGESVQACLKEGKVVRFPKEFNEKIKA